MRHLNDAHVRTTPPVTHCWCNGCFARCVVTGPGQQPFALEWLRYHAECLTENALTDEEAKWLKRATKGVLSMAKKKGKGC